MKKNVASVQEISEIYGHTFGVADEDSLNLLDFY